MNAETECGREPLVDAIAGFLTHMNVSRIAEIRATVGRVIDEAGPEAIEDLRRRLIQAGTEWNYFPKDPLARRVHHVLADWVLREKPVLLGRKNLDVVGRDPVVIFANHLSYSDANAVDVILEQSGYQELSNRLAVVAGPKVYSDIRRRFSSLCFGTIKVPQNSGRATDDAVMRPRELALAARRSIQSARRSLASGEALLIFPEGTRSRSGRMQPFLPGVARYVQGADAWVLPLGIWGTEALFPMGEQALSSAPLTINAGRPIRADALIARAGADRSLMMDSVGFAIAALMPPQYRGAYGEGPIRTRAAQSLGAELFD
jgi:1-acyl-sn-glycerol-3-phosphate acyltransferase